MTLLADIRATLATVVSSASGLGEVWQYRTLTSVADVTPRTYSAFADVDAVCQITHLERYDERRQCFVRDERAAWCVADSVVLKQGDQVKSPASEIYAVLGVRGRISGGGTITYDIGRAVPLVQGADRGQGI